MRTAATKYASIFRTIDRFSTDERDQNRVSYEVTKKVLSTLNLVADEKVGFVEKKEISRIKDTVFPFREIDDVVNRGLRFDFRDEVEADSSLVQFIPVAVVKDKNSMRFLTGRKAARAMSAESPERDRVLLYFGGHLREEDGTLFDHPTSIEVLKQCLYREVKEEIGIDVDSEEVDPCCIWVRDGSKSENHLAVVFVIERNLDHIKVAIDDAEFIRWEKKGSPGTGAVIDEDGIVTHFDDLDSWSRNIAAVLFGITPEAKEAASLQKSFF
jgi:predicted NUDIX family phosphoesterase